MTEKQQVYVKTAPRSLAPPEGSVNTASAYDEIFHRLGRFPNLTDDQRDAFALTLDAVLVDQISDSELAGIVSGDLPNYPLRPGAGQSMGLPGAQQTSRYVGATVSGAPTTGTFHVGDFVIAQDGHVWVCTVAGSPGTWVNVALADIVASTPDATTSVKGLVKLAGDLAGTATSPTVPGLASKQPYGVPTAVKTASYTAAANDLIPVDTTSNPVTITLPAGPADKTRVIVKHVVQGGTNAVTITRGGSTDVFNKTGGSTSLTLTTLNQSMTLQYQSSIGVWYVVVDSPSLAVLNGTFVPVAGNSTITGTKTFTGVVQTTGPITPDMPEYYGAVGDGVADDTAAVTSARDAAQWVKLTRGRIYGVTSSIALASNRRIFTEAGGYQGATIKALAGYDTASGAILSLTGTATQLQSVAVDATLVPTVNCIQTESTAFSPILRDVKTSGGLNGLRNLSLETHVDHCLFRTAAGSGLRNEQYDLLCVDTSTDGCLDGFRSTDGFGSATLFHFHAIKSSRRGFYLVGADRTLMFGCHADTSGQNGMQFESTRYLSVVGCYSFQSSSPSSGGTADTYSDYYFSTVARSDFVGCQSGGASYTLNDLRADGVQAEVKFIGFYGNKTTPIAGAAAATGLTFIGCGGGWAQYATPWAPLNAITSGETTLPNGRDDALSQTVAMTSGTMRLTYFTARKTETITQVRSISGTTAAAATPTLIRIGIYSVDASTGDLTLVASTAADTNSYAAAQSAYTRNLTASFGKVAGVRYAVGTLVVSGATMPTVAGKSTIAGGSTSEAGVAPRMTGTVASLTDLPSSVTAGSLGNTVSQQYVALVP